MGMICAGGGRKARQAPSWQPSLKTPFGATASPGVQAGLHGGSSRSLGLGVGKSKPRKRAREVISIASCLWRPGRLADPPDLWPSLGRRGRMDVLRSLPAGPVQLGSRASVPKGCLVLASPASASPPRLTRFPFEPPFGNKREACAGSQARMDN